jgi:hypothetical protein
VTNVELNWTKSRLLHSAIRVISTRVLFIWLLVQLYQKPMNSGTWLLLEQEPFDSSWEIEKNA